MYKFFTIFQVFVFLIFLCLIVFGLCKIIDNQKILIGQIEDYTILIETSIE